MWARFSHMLEPLTKLKSSKEIFKWTEVKEKAFEEIKPIMARNIVLACTDLNK